MQSCRRICVWPPCVAAHRCNNVPPPAVDPGKKLAAAAPRPICASSCELLGEPLRAVAACRVAAALQTCLRIAAYNGRLVQILPRKQLQMLRSSAAAQLGGSPRLQRQLAGSHCRLVCERWRGGAAELCKKLPPRLRILRQSCEFFGEAFACNGSCPLQQTGLPAMQDDSSHNSAEFLQLFNVQIISGNLSNE